MAALTAGRTYVIRNRKSGNVLNVAAYSTGSSAKLETWSLQSDLNRPSQVWHLFPLDQGTCLLVNKRSGHLANVASNSAQPSAGLEQLTDGATMHTWMLREAPGGGYHIVNKRSGLYMNVSGNSSKLSAPVEQYYLQNTAEAAEVWNLEIEDEYKTVLDAGHVERDPADVGDIVRLTSYKQPAKTQTEPVLIGRVALPFVMVADPALPRERQSAESPYYLLSRYGYWKLVYFFEHGGASEYTKTQEVRVGLSTTNAKEVESTVGISVTAEASFGYGGFSGSLSATVSAELKVTTSTSTTQESSRTDTVSRTYPAGKRVSETIWYKEDKYVLTRLDGTTLTEWVVRDPDTCITDAYPSDAPPAPPQIPPRARLIVKHSGQAIDIEGAGTGNGAQAVQWNAGGGDNQKFELRDAGDGSYRIVAKHSGKVLAVEGASTGNGARVIQWSSGSDANERFELRDAGDGYYRLVARHSGKVLAIEYASRDAGARLIQWDSGGDDNEKFRLEPISDASW
ncbi:hypothetical protein GCM10009850_037570 [Nonomuraea monospora]|uniref:Ricin B lectin domain-containing protein n=1 Tax=Nonomuraea monospora TaxID=568818 RepID=A0ABN3CGK6_9ACTN